MTSDRQQRLAEVNQRIAEAKKHQLSTWEIEGLLTLKRLLENRQ